LIQQKRAWIVKKQAFLGQKKEQYLPKQFIDGEIFYFFGTPYRFCLVDGHAIRLAEHLEFPRKFLPHAGRRLIRWYKKAAYEKIKERVEHYSKLTGLVYTSVKISSAKKRVGSCSGKGHLNFSWRLIMAPIETVDYVVVHELVHIVEKNHRRTFWNKVHDIIPDYKIRAKWLKENNGLLNVL